MLSVGDSRCRHDRPGGSRDRSHITGCEARAVCPGRHSASVGTGTGAVGGGGVRGSGVCSSSLRRRDSSPAKDGELGQKPSICTHVESRLDLRVGAVVD